MRMIRSRVPIAPLTATAILAAVASLDAAMPASISPASTLPPNTLAADVFVTNRVPRFITNIVEVRIPMNVFRDEFRTNWVDQFRTNIIDVFKTNSIYRALTNTVVVQITQTNWETALVFKTNWVTRVVTNTVQIDLPAAAPISPAQPRAQMTPPASPPAQTIGEAQELRIEMARTDKRPDQNQVEVQLAVRSASDPAVELQIQEWRLVRSDGTVLLFGQRREFTTDLACGNYTVIVKLRRHAGDPVTTVVGNMELAMDGTAQRAPVVVLNSR